MSSIARDRIRRCLAMIPLIRARPGIRIPELASIFGVPETEIWEDITEVLTMCGVPPYLPEFSRREPSNPKAQGQACDHGRTAVSDRRPGVPSPIITSSAAMP